MKTKIRKRMSIVLVGIASIVAHGAEVDKVDVYNVHSNVCDLLDNGQYEKAVSLGRGIWPHLKYSETELRYKVAINIAQAYVAWWKNSDTNDLIMTWENLLRAEKYLREAKKVADTGFPSEREILGRVLSAHKDIMAICRKRAEQGNADAQYALAVLYGGYGHIEASDYVAAVKWARKAADQGHAKAQEYLGMMYRGGWGVEKNYVEAVKWYRKAAEQGDSSGQCALGVMYNYGWGVDKDPEKAVEWYRKSAEQGCAGGLCNLGICYMNGDGVKKDEKEAVRLYRKAAEQVSLEDGGGGVVQLNLGNCYRDGRGVKKDVQEAIKWYKKAAAQGNETARKALKELGEDVGKDAESHSETTSHKKEDVLGAHEMTPPLGMVRGICTIGLSPCNLFRAWPLGFEEGDLFVGMILLPIGSTLVMSGCVVCDVANGALDVCSFGTYGNWLYTDGYTPWFWQRHNSFQGGIMTEHRAWTSFR